MTNINYQPLTAEYFHAVSLLGNTVHGEGYLCPDTLKNWVNKGITNNINSSFVALDDKKIVGFRITFPANNWLIDK